MVLYLPTGAGTPTLESITDEINVKDTPHSAVGGGTTDDRAAFASADASATSTGTVFIPKGTYKISSNITLTAALRFANGAVLSPDAGVVVTINGTIQAGIYKIFTTGAGTVVLSNKVREAYPQWWGAIGDSVTDDTAAFQSMFNAVSNFGRVHIPDAATFYLITATVNVAAVTVDKMVHITADRNSTKHMMRGTINAAPLLKMVGNTGALGVTIDGLRVQNLSTSGTSLEFRGFITASLRNCLIAGGLIGLDAAGSTQSLHIDNCAIRSSVASGTIGMLLGGHAEVTASDVVGWDHGIRAFGPVVNITGSRFEVNKVGIMIGQNRAGGTQDLARSFIGGLSFEANDTHIQIDGLADSVLSGIGMQGSTNAPAGQSIYGINVNGTMTGVTLQGINVGGSYTTAGFRLNGAANQTRVVLQAVTSAISGGGGVNWDVGSSALDGSATFIQTNSGYDGQIPIQADPVSPVQAQTWLSTTTANTVKYYDSVAIRSLVDLSLTQTLTSKTLSSPTLSGTVAGTPTWGSGQTFPSINLGGATVVDILSATASLDFTALAANSCEVLTIAVTGAADGDTVCLGVPTALADVDGATERTTFFGWVSAADTVSVRRCNVTGTATADPAAATVRATVLKF